MIKRRVKNDAEGVEAEEAKDAQNIAQGGKKKTKTKKKYLENQSLRQTYLVLQESGK